MLRDNDGPPWARTVLDAGTTRTAWSWPSSTSAGGLVAVCPVVPLCASGGAALLGFPSYRGGVPAQRGVHPGRGPQRRRDLADRLAVLGVQLGALLGGDRGGWSSVGSSPAVAGGSRQRREPWSRAPRGPAETFRDLSDAQPLGDVQVTQGLHRGWGRRVPGRSPRPAGGPVRSRARMRSSTLESVTPNALAIRATCRPWSSRDRTWSSVMVGCRPGGRSGTPQRPPDGCGPSQRCDANVPITARLRP